MNTRRFISVVALLLLWVGSTYAQEELTETYTMFDGPYSVGYPAGWSIEEAQGAMVLSDGQPIFDVFNARLDEFPGDNVNLVMIPSSILNLGELEDDSPTGIVRAVSGGWLINPDSTEAIEINGIAAAQLVDTSDDRVLDSMIVMIDFEDTPLIIVAQTQLDGLEAYMPTLMAIIESISVGDGNSQPMLNEDLELAEFSIDTVSDIRPVVQDNQPDSDYFDASFSPSGSRVALINQFDTVKIVDAISGDVVNEFAAPGNYVSFATEDIVAVHDGDSTLNIYSVTDGELMTSYTVVNFGGIRFDGEQAVILQAVEADTVLGIDLVVNDLETGEPTAIESFAGFDQIEPGIAFSDTRAAFVAGPLLFVVDVTNITFGDPLVSMDTDDPENEFNAYQAVGISPDGNTVVVTDERYQIIAYDANNGEMLYQIDRAEMGSNLSWVTFSNDGTLLFVTERETLLVIDAATGELLRSMPSTIPGNFEVLEVSQDGRYLLGAAYEAFNVWAAPVQ